MTTYVDTSALLKLLFREAETSALQAWFGANAQADIVSSLLIRTEAHCASRRRDPSARPSVVDAVLGLVELVDLLAVDLETAATGARRLRAADAIHLATAERVGATSVLVYDTELALAAEAAGLQVITPR